MPASMSPDDFKPGVYQHYKGPHYLALGLAREDESDELVVVYVRLYERAGLPMNTRRLSVWSQPVTTPDGQTRPRFSYVGVATPAP